MKKVLVVDDTKNIRMLITTSLEVEGYKVITASNGNEALEIFQNTSLDLAFMDIKMPAISGTEVLKRIRSIGNNTPVVIMTAFATVKNAIDCTKLGAVAYLQKPFTTEKIKNVLKEIEYLIEDNKLCLDCAKDLISKNQLDNAEKILKEALIKDAECGEVYYLMGQIHNIKGESDKAEKFYKAAQVFNYKL